MPPVITEFTRMPRAPQRAARVRASPVIADLAAAYRKLTGYEAGQKAGHDAGRAEGLVDRRDERAGDIGIATRKDRDLMASRGELRRELIVG